MKKLNSTLTAVALCLVPAGLGAQEPVAEPMQEPVYGSPSWTGTDNATWDSDADGRLSRDEAADAVYDVLDEDEWDGVVEFGA